MKDPGFGSIYEWPDHHDLAASAQRPRWRRGRHAARATGASRSHRPSRRIVKARDQGETYAAIAEALAVEGILSPLGKPTWQSSTVRLDLRQSRGHNGIESDGMQVVTGQLGRSQRISRLGTATPPQSDGQAIARSRGLRPHLRGNAGQNANDSVPLTVGGPRVRGTR